MATTSDIRTGLVIEYKGHRMKIVQFLHVKPGKGGAFVRTKLKNIVTGQVMDVTFRGGEKLTTVRVEKHRMQYLYDEGDSFVFMNADTYEQIFLLRELIAEEMSFIKEGTMVDLTFIGDEVIGISPPLFVELEVTESEPGVRGNTATGATKPATLETGHNVNVPLFVDIGDRLKIDTRTGEYVERVK
ncbi:MAG: elongation factor P [Candidatus Neomarinimicrobiota bacterium]|nr:elongation factor P [Candidatus Neomarinimicrobiota bacterium]